MRAARAVLLLLCAVGCERVPPPPSDLGLPPAALPAGVLAQMPQRPSRAPLPTLLPPIGSHERWPELAFALCHTRSDLQFWAGHRAPSAAAFFGWVRAQDDVEREYWCVDLGVEYFELLAARGSREWRSGPQAYATLAPTQQRWPLSPAQALASLRVPEATGFCVRDRRLHLVTADGLREIRLGDDGELTLRELRSWERLGIAYADRLRLLAPAIPALSLQLGARVFEFEPCNGSWRVDGQLLAQGDEVALRALCAWPERPGEWLLLDADGRTLRRHRGAWRARPARAPSRRSPAIVTVEPELAQAFPLWARSDQTSALALRQVGAEHAQALAPYHIAMEHSGARWRIEAPGLDARTLWTALERAWSQAPPWLRAPARLEGQPQGAALSLQLEPPLPDLLERLAHPLLWPRGSGLPRRSGLLPWRPAQPAAISLPALHGVDAARSRLAGASAPIVLLLSSLSASSTRGALREALLGRELPGRDGSLGPPRTPILGEPIERPAAATARARGSFYLLVEEGVLPAPERERSLQRLAALAQARGLLLQELQSLEGLRLQPEDAVGRIARLPLHSGEPLLRAAELAHWLRLPFEVDPALWRLPPEHAQRVAVARAFEAQLLASGQLLPLWSQSLDLQLPRSIQCAELSPVGMPPLLWELRESACPR